MIAINVKVDIDQAIAKLNATAQEARKAVPQALNKVASLAKTQAAREIRDAGYGLKVGDIKSAISIRRANGNELRAGVRALGRPIPLIGYGARQTRLGVTVNVKNGRKLIPHAFIATVGSGHKGVFVRVGNQHKWVSKNGKRYQSGLPIKQLYGPSIPAAFANDTVQTALVAMIKQRFPDVLASQLSFAISKR